MIEFSNFWFDVFFFVVNFGLTLYVAGRCFERQSSNHRDIHAIAKRLRILENATNVRLEAFDFILKAHVTDKKMMEGIKAKDS
jgi:hypothetical protein